MSYDLRRLRLHGLIRRIDGRHRYVLTEQGRDLAVRYYKSCFTELFCSVDLATWNAEKRCRHQQFLGALLLG